MGITYRSSIAEPWDQDAHPFQMTFAECDKGAVALAHAQLLCVACCPLESGNACWCSAVNYKEGIAGSDH